MAVSRIDLTTAGTKVGWAVETTAGTKPTSYEHLIGINSIPEINPEPNNIDATTLDELTQKVYVQGLKDQSSAIGFGANITQVLVDQWAAAVEAAKTAKAAGKKTWLAIKTTGINKAWFIPCELSPLGIPAMDVDSVITGNLYITQTGEIEQDDAPTFTDYSGT